MIREKVSEPALHQASHAAYDWAHNFSQENDGDVYMVGCACTELHRPPPWNLSLATKRQESEMVIFELVERLLLDNSLQPHQVASLACIQPFTDPSSLRASSFTKAGTISLG